jgi:hypothetical protein
MGERKTQFFDLHVEEVSSIIFLGEEVSSYAEFILRMEK